MKLRIKSQRLSRSKNIEKIHLMYINLRNWDLIKSISRRNYKIKEYRVKFKITKWKISSPQGIGRVAVKSWISIADISPQNWKCSSNTKLKIQLRNHSKSKITNKKLRKYLTKIVKLIKNIIKNLNRKR